MTARGKKRASGGGRIRPALAVFLLVLLAEMLLYTWARVQCVQVGYRIDDQRQRHGRLVSLNKQLKIERTRLEAPLRIRRLARNQLGLITPGPEQTVIVP